MALLRGGKMTASMASSEVVLHADYNFRSGYNADTTNSQYTWIDGYGVIDASLGYRFGKTWEVKVFARNLFDKGYVTALTAQSGNSGFILVQAGDPRTFGVNVCARF